MFSKDNVILLGQLARIHGYPKNGLQRWKVQLYSPGTDAFRHIQHVYVSAENKDLLHPNECRKLELRAPAEALGAEWSRSPAVILSVDEKESFPKDAHVGIRREDFPPLQGKSEFYLCDLLGRRVSTDEAAESFALIKSIYDASKVGGLSSWIVVMEDPQMAKVFEMPLELMLKDTRNDSRWEDLQTFLIADELKNWMALADDEESEKSDEENEVEE